MRKFEISRVSLALSSPLSPSLIVCGPALSFSLPLSLKKYNSAGSHKRLIRISSLPHCSLPLLTSRRPLSLASAALWEIIKAPGIRHSRLLLFLCLFAPLPLCRPLCNAANGSEGVVFVDNRDYTPVAATPPPRRTIDQRPIDRP